MEQCNVFEDIGGNQWVSASQARADLVDEARWAMRRIVEGRAGASDRELVTQYAAWSGELPTPAPVSCPECDGTGVCPMDPTGPAPSVETCPKCGGTRKA